MSRVRVCLSNGDVCIVRGYVDDVREQLEVGRLSGVLLVALEADRIPTGQKLYVNPNEVATVKSGD